MALTLSARRGDRSSVGHFYRFLDNRGICECVLENAPDQLSEADLKLAMKLLADVIDKESRTWLSYCEDFGFYFNYETRVYYRTVDDLEISASSNFHRTMEDKREMVEWCEETLEKISRI
jgi:hypothetical protein